MAKVPLRIYNREIENLTDRGQTEEAIAHCLYILKTYSKHLDTYRLLGKAFLEGQRFGEATDIFQRVLSAIPDDFVSHIGMSIIREDEGDLDGAIWHMERAFDAQPSNAAVQDELRRLYGRRDGLEPPRVRLTRGALVRMYARGDLYFQAIAEIRAALKEDPQRPDLKVVLARMYHLSGQQVEAAEVCSDLLKKFPYCFEANRILSEILPETSRAEEAEIYKQRVYALDPYMAFVNPASPLPTDVPDNAVLIERQEWAPDQEADYKQPQWASSLGIQIEGSPTESSQIPDWLMSSEAASAAPADLTAQSPFTGESRGRQKKEKRRTSPLRRKARFRSGCRLRDGELPPAARPKGRCRPSKKEQPSWRRAWLPPKFPIGCALSRLRS